MNLRLEKRQRGAWYGVAVGDALGAPHEFSLDEVVAALPLPLVMQAGGPWRAGEWTDDTTLTLAASRAYRDGEFLPGQAAAAMVEWLLDEPKDVGLLTRQALTRIIEGSSTFETAVTGR